MSRVRDRALSAVTAVALVLVFAVAVVVGLDTSPSKPIERQSVSEFVMRCGQENGSRSLPPDCPPTLYDVQTEPSPRPYDPTP